jgi:hypothetical protein
MVFLICLPSCPPDTYLMPVTSFPYLHAQDNVPGGRTRLPQPRAKTTPPCCRLLAPSFLPGSRKFHVLQYYVNEEQTTQDGQNILRHLLAFCIYIPGQSLDYQGQTNYTTGWPQGSHDQRPHLIRDMLRSDEQLTISQIASAAECSRKAVYYTVFLTPNDAA